MLRTFSVSLLVVGLTFGSAAGVVLQACTPALPPPSTSASTLVSARKAASKDSARAADWLLLELLAPGGNAAEARTARDRLDKSGRHGPFEDLARGLDDELHGRLGSASDHYLAAARAARAANHPSSPWIAWFSIQQAISASSNTQGLWKRNKAWVAESLQHPKHLGWRARDLLVKWWSQESWAEAASDVESITAEKLGCLRSLRLAGPFGSGSRASALESFPAESTAPWPKVWPRDERYDQLPRILKSEQDGCMATVDEVTKNGVYFAEALFKTDAEQSAIVSVENALKVWVDGTLVLDRDLRRFGSWTKVGVGVTIPAGPHRVVAKLVDGRTAVRLLHADGRPLKVEPSGASPSAVPLASPTRPHVSFDANPTFDPSEREDGASVALRYIAAALAHSDNEDGVATLLVEPLVKDTKLATGAALSLAAEFVSGDPIYNTSQTEDLIRELNQLALARDPDLWKADLERVKKIVQSKGLVDAAPQLKKLTERYQQVPALTAALASIYGELGWTPEYREVAMRSAERFPESIDGLFTSAQLLEAEGQRQEAQALYDRIRELDPDSEVFVGRALERKDFDLALSELQRLHERRPKRKELLEQIATVKRLAGAKYDMWKLLEDAVARDPKSGPARLSLADAHFAQGEPGALNAALVLALEKGANAGPLKRALDLVEGLTELEPYRLDGKDVIAA
ncbi:MAG: hypothetical protein RJA70_2449, partial [Pseudomonadota bacterium]